jgi:hypothetical protein
MPILYLCQTTSPFLEFLSSASADDEGRALTDAIRSTETIAFSDGPFADQYDTAARELEGASSLGRIIGRVIALGGENDHSPYRSELTGLFVQSL